MTRRRAHGQRIARTRIVFNPAIAPAIAAALHDQVNAHAPGIASEGSSSPAITEWLVVTCLTDLDTGESYLSGFTSENLLAHHREGLLHQCLYGGMWTDDPEDQP